VAIGSASSVQILQAPSPRVATYPRRFGVIPRRARSFQHRIDAQAALSRSRSAGQYTLLVGTGGVGKTQLAAAYASEAWDSRAVDLLLWVSASSSGPILDAYARAAVELLGADPGDPATAGSRFLEWLADCEQRWLIVLDDVPDSGTMADLWPPRSPTGRVLVTTQNDSAALRGDCDTTVPVGLFTAAEAEAYAAEVLDFQHRKGAPGQIARLAQDLGLLPLALAQALTYIVDTGIDCAEYCRRLADRSRRLASVVPEAGHLPDGQRRPLAAAWSLSLERADALNPQGLAAPMLRLISFLGPTAIHSCAVTSEPARTYLAAHRSARAANTGAAQQLVTVDDAADAVRCLQRLSLLGHDSNDDIVVHGLIQRVTRDGIGPDDRSLVVRAAAEALAESWHRHERDTALHGTLSPCTDALSEHADSLLWTEGCHHLLFHRGNGLEEAGHLMAAAAYWQELFGRSQQQLGADHPDTFRIAAKLAAARHSIGVDADQDIEQLLTDAGTVLGASDPDMMIIRRLLLRARAALVVTPGAVADLESELAALTGRHGAQDRAVMAVRNDLAVIHGQAGGRQRAARELQELVLDYCNSSDPYGAEALLAWNNLVYWLNEAGHPAAAIATGECLLSQIPVQCRLGNDPGVLALRGNVAQVRGDSGDVKGARRELEDLYQDELRVLGPLHETTLSTRHCLALAHIADSDPQRALEYLEPLLDDVTKVLGPTHPRTLQTQATVAHARGQAGDFGGAAAGFLDLVRALAPTYGPFHREMLGAFEGWQHWFRQDQGRVPAESDLMRIFGPQAEASSDGEP